MQQTQRIRRRETGDSHTANGRRGLLRTWGKLSTKCVRSVVVVVVVVVITVAAVAAAAAAAAVASGMVWYGSPEQ